jgi:glycosyltransferase involved in cell wall biosynthesis
MKVVVSHPTGNQNVRELCKGLLKKEQLSIYYTSFGILEGSLLNKINSPLFKNFIRRSYPIEFKSKIKFFSIYDLCRLVSIKLGFSSLYHRDNSIFSDYSVFQKFDRFVSRNLSKSKFDVFYGYVGSSIQSMKEARRLGKIIVLEQHGCYWEKANEITNLEAAKNPNWKETLRFTSFTQERKKRLTQELYLADKIIVASEFCKSTLPENLQERITVIPYGFPTPNLGRIYKTNGKLRLLYVGNLTQLKGISYLFEAVEDFQNEVDLTLIGSMEGSNSKILKYNLEKYNYLGTLNNGQVLEQMGEHDILIFPSLMDAFGMVITEAMSQGTPVIATYNSAGPEIIDHEKDGWLIEAGSTKAIKNVLVDVLNDRRKVELMGKKALEKAAKRNWATYHESISQTLISFCQ